MGFHVPVMVAEVVDGLVTDPDGIYIDATVGGGGHGEALLQATGSAAHLLACDRDETAVLEAGRRLAPHAGRVTVLQCAFSSLTRSAAPVLTALARSRSVPGVVSGVLFDLGVSSHQIDVSQRGFSYQQEGPLDMRMNRGAGMPAAQLLDRISEADLAALIRRYGEERQARRIARAICRARDEGDMMTTADLTRAIERTRPRMLTKTLARVFQALRIVVNDELGELEAGLRAATQLVGPGGRIAVIAYHSLEDRLVKQSFARRVRGCVCPPDLPVCACGRRPSFRAVGRARRASAHEVATNPRARSAVLRLYEKLRPAGSGEAGA